REHLRPRGPAVDLVATAGQAVRHVAALAVGADPRGVADADHRDAHLVERGPERLVVIGYPVPARVLVGAGDGGEDRVGRIGGQLVEDVVRPRFTALARL